MLTLNNPPANAYSHEMHKELDAAILDARFDDDVHVIVLTGAGDKFFCAGADIAMLEQVTPAWKYNFCLHANETLCRLEQTPKLVVAALNGHTVGGGLEVAMAADLRVARAGGGKIGLPEVKLGVLPGTGGTQRLLRLVGKARALEMMASGRLYTFEEAEEPAELIRSGLAGELEELSWASFLSEAPPRRSSGARPAAIPPSSRSPLASAACAPAP